MLAAELARERTQRQKAESDFEVSLSKTLYHHLRRNDTNVLKGCMPSAPCAQ